MPAGEAIVIGRTDWVESITIDDTLVTAPPGCGKTELLAQRAAFLVQSGMVNLPRQVLAITYSRKAMANLAERLRQHLGPHAERHVAVTNFHRLGFRLARHHGPLVGHCYTERTLGVNAPLRRIRNETAEEHGVYVGELSDHLRAVKCGGLTDDEVMERLSPAGAAYEARLRAEGRRDYDDAIRLGTLLLRIESVALLYRERFPLLLIDEAHDLSEAHLDMIEPIGHSRTAFAGDRSQGIYGFAGAAPAQVYERIESRAMQHVSLNVSYRSAPAILEAVNWSSELLGGDTLTAAPEINWPDDGIVSVQDFRHPDDETAWLVPQIEEWLSANPDWSIGVMVRSGRRRRWLDQALSDAQVPHELWDHAAHKPQLVNRFRRFLSSSIEAAGDGVEGLGELFLRCAETIDVSDMETMDQLNDAADTLEELVATEGLRATIENIRIAADPATPAPPGVHLLNGHLGKGQQFDRVVVLGMEEGHIPDYRAKSTAALKEELSVLHVITSRAVSELYFTCCVDVPHSDRPWLREPSRWLDPIRLLTNQ